VIIIEVDWFFGQRLSRLSMLKPKLGDLKSCVASIASRATKISMARFLAL